MSCARIVVRELREIEQGVQGRVAAADDQDPTALYRREGAEHVGDTVEDALAGGAFAEAGRPDGAERPGDSMVPEASMTAPGQHIALAAGAGDPHQERRGVAGPSFIRSWSCRATPITRELNATCGASSAVPASGSR